jgi:hypothetical protein
MSQWGGVAAAGDTVSGAPKVRHTSRGLMTHFGRAASLGLMGAVLVLTQPSVVSACIGNMDFGAAVAGTRGGIAEGRVLDATYSASRGTLVQLTDTARVRGDPPISTSVWLMMGDVCDQGADPGDTLWLLYDLEDFDEPPGLAVAFVVEGSDAVLDEEVRAALAALPETDFEGRVPTAPDLGDRLWLLLIGLVTVLLSVVRPRVTD